jgi:hypothetical protein
VILALLSCITMMISGCGAPPHSEFAGGEPASSEFSEFIVPGKIGKAAATGVGYAAIPLDVALAVVTVPAMIIWMELDPPGGEMGGFAAAKAIQAAPLIPGLLLEYGTYYGVTAVTSVPGYLLTEVPETVVDAVVSDRVLMDRLLARYKTLSDREYRILVETSGRNFPPRRASPRRPILGHKPSGGTGGRDEWKRWREAGQPTDPAEEARFWLNYHVMEGNPEAGRRFGDRFFPGEKLFERFTGAGRQDVIDYYDQAQDGRPEDQNEYKFWVTHHGGVDAVVEKAVEEGRL